MKIIFPKYAPKYAFKVMIIVAFLFLAALRGTAAAHGEEIRVNLLEVVELSKDKTQGEGVFMHYNDTVLVEISRDNAFFSGVELELNAPQQWISEQGVLAVVIYSNIAKTPAKGSGIVKAEQIRLDTLPKKIQTVYHIPIKKEHNIKNTPYVTIISNLAAGDFPLLFRIMPVTREINEEVQNMRFELKVKPIISDEGMLKLNIRYPESLQNKAYTVLIDDQIIEKPEEELFYKEGEHHLMLVSADYRNESRRFIIERAKTLELNLTLQDLTPLILFETPGNAKIFVDNVRFPNTSAPKAIEAGAHEIKIQVSDYTVIKNIFVHKGKTYKVSFIVDLDVLEED